MIFEGVNEIQPLRLCAVNLTGHESLQRGGISNVSWTWGTEEPCLFDTFFFANGTLVIRPDVLPLSDGSLAYVRLFPDGHAEVVTGNVTQGVSSTYTQLGHRPTIGNVRTFADWSTVVHVAAGTPTFAFELVGEQDHSALRLDVFNGDVYLRGVATKLLTVTDALQVSWTLAGLEVNGVVVPYEFRYLPRMVHVYATRAGSDLRVRIVHNDDPLVAPDARVFTSPTRAVYDDASEVQLPAASSTTFQLEAVLAGSLGLPGIGEVRTLVDTPMRLEGDANPVVVPLRLEIGDVNGGFSDATATHAAVYTPVWQLANYSAGDQVLYDGYSYEARVSTIAVPPHADWALLSHDHWPHGGRLRVIPPIAVESLLGASYVTDTLGESLYAGVVTPGTVHDLNATAWRVNVRAYQNDALVWNETESRPFPTPRRMILRGAVDALTYVAGDPACVGLYNVTDVARASCGDQPCTWPHKDPRAACAATNAYGVPDAFESLSSASVIDWESFCNYAHPPDFDWSGVHFGYEWHHFCNASDLVCADAEWTDRCFQRVEPYADTCSRTCMDTLRERVDGAICDRVNRLSNVSKLVGGACNGEACAIDFTPRTFCETQEAYHDIRVSGVNVTHRVLLPFLDATSCSATCSAHLRSILDWSDWEQTCAALGSGARPGYCSTSSCDCETGFDGQQCELECPIGSADGQDATCSGANGFCIPLSTAEFVVDTGKQEEMGEYVAGDPFKTNQPLWMGGPETVQGVCQCTTGSGEDCSLRCEKSNNGTYGPGLRSQYGICDSNLATVKALPPCTRYNADFLTESGLSVPYNSTTYDQAVLVYPQRLLFCDLDTLYRGAVSAVSGEAAPAQPMITPAPLEAWRVLTEICWPWGNSTARRETHRKASQVPVYNASHWYWTLEGSLNVTSAWEADAGLAHPMDRVPSFLATVDRAFNVSGTVLGVRSGAPGERSLAWAAYDKHVIVRGVPPMNRERASWAVYGSVVLMYGGRIFMDVGDGCSAANVAACEGQSSSELWRFDVSTPGVVTMDVHAVPIDGPGYAHDRPFAAAEGMAFLWTDDSQLWRLDLTDAWSWSVVGHVVDTSVTPSAEATLAFGVLTTRTCALDTTQATLECVAPGNTTIGVEWNPPTPSETGCMLTLQDGVVRLDADMLVQFSNAPTTLHIFLHDLKTMDETQETFSLRVRNAVQIPKTC